MKKLPPIQTLAAPLCRIALSLVLLLLPDAVSALVGIILGWLLLICGIAAGYFVLRQPQRPVTRILSALALVLVGLWLQRNPLALAANLGRLAGVLLLISGALDYFDSRKQGRILSGLTLLAGVVLLLLPQTLSRLVLRILGLLVLATGVADLISRLQSPQPPRDDQIIDAL